MQVSPPLTAACTICAVADWMDATFVEQNRNAGCLVRCTLGETKPAAPAAHPLAGVPGGDGLTSCGIGHGGLSLGCQILISADCRAPCSLVQPPGRSANSHR